MRSTVGGVLISLGVAFGAGCDATEGGPLEVASVSPSEGSVAGGTRVTITGSGFSPDTVVRIGDAICGSVHVDGPGSLSCTTGDHRYIEGASDVVVSRPSAQAMLPGAFMYQCPWTTSEGRRSCGAAPAPAPAEQVVDSWVTQFEAGHGFDPDAGVGRSSAGDTSNFVLGTQSAFIETDGAGTPRTISRASMEPIDFTDRMAKVWIKVDNVDHVRSLDLVLGDSSFANSYTFKLASTQAQQWTTDGDWVAFTIPWAADAMSTRGSPDRSSICDVMLRVTDDGTGVPVRLHVNGIALVREPVDTFPRGLLTFTFDDGFASMVTPGAEILADHGFAATAYVIVDMVEKTGRVRLADLTKLDADGWDIAVHAATDLHHHARYNKLTAREVEDDMVEARAWLMRHGFSGYDHCAYPGGDFSGGADVLALARRYFTSCRTIYNRQHETLPVSDGTKLRVVYVTNGTQLATVKAAVEHARTSREWLILVFHQLVDGTPAKSTEWNTGDFTSLVKFVDAQNIPVATVSQVLGT